MASPSAFFAPSVVLPPHCLHVHLLFQSAWNIQEDSHVCKLQLICLIGKFGASCRPAVEHEILSSGQIWCKTGRRVVYPFIKQLFMLRIGCTENIEKNRKITYPKVLQGGFGTRPYPAYFTFAGVGLSQTRLSAYPQSIVRSKSIFLFDLLPKGFYVAVS
jgi:hypothetical protein